MPEIFIPGNVPSLKNSKVATSRGVFMSKTCRKYLQSLGIKSYSVRDRYVSEHKTRPNVMGDAVACMRDYLAAIDPPHVIWMHFIRDSRRKFDFLNAAQIICDLLTAYRVVADDDMGNLIPMPLKISGEWFSVDRKRAGVIIRYGE